MIKTKSVFYGNEQIVSSLCDLARHKSLRHAYLFHGASGIGKATCASWFVTFLESDLFGPSGGTLIDSLFMVPEKDRMTIGIEAVRKAQEFLWQTPLSSPYRTLVVDNAHALTIEAQSAMLKLVEDPPSHALFIFIADSVEILVPPLCSRLAKIYFRTLTKEIIEEFLIKEKECSKEQAKKVASRSFGRIGRALSLITSNKKKAMALADELEEKQVLLWEKDPAKFAPTLRWFSEQIAIFRRYNINEALQRKAVEYYISQH